MAPVVDLLGPGVSESPTAPVWVSGCSSFAVVGQVVVGVAFVVVDTTSVEVEKALVDAEADPGVERKKMGELDSSEDADIHTVPVGSVELFARTCSFRADHGFVEMLQMLESSTVAYDILEGKDVAYVLPPSGQEFLVHRSVR